MTCSAVEAGAAVGGAEGCSGGVVVVGVGRDKLHAVEVLTS